MSVKLNLWSPCVSVGCVGAAHDVESKINHVKLVAGLGLPIALIVD